MPDERGFSLLEALIATSILAVSLVSLGELFGLAIRSNIAARRTTMATVLARQTLEELRAVPWPELHQSPANALQENTPGFVDHIDQFGAIRGSGAEPPADGVYTRRWAIEPLPSTPDTVVIQVRVTRTAVIGAARVPEEARLITARTRKPS
jgi:type II secretory pathway pseudopilin PulG